MSSNGVSLKRSEIRDNLDALIDFVHVVLDGAIEHNAAPELIADLGNIAGSLETMHWTI